MDKAVAPFVRSLEQLRDAHQWSIAEMARRAGLPKRSMENYFKGHKPGLDALVAMARGYGVTVDFLTGMGTEPSPTNELEAIVFEAAYPTILSVVRGIGSYTLAGRTIYTEDTIFSEPMEVFAKKQANEVARRFNVNRSYLETIQSGSPPISSLSSEPDE